MGSFVHKLSYSFIPQQRRESKATTQLMFFLERSCSN
jgi:hypothetical protein